MWWVYFKNRSVDEALGASAAVAFAWGYGHYFVFAAVAALGAGLQVATDAIFDPGEVGPVTAALTVAVPVVVYLVAVGLLHGWPASRQLLAPMVIASGAILITALAAGTIGIAVAVLMMSALVAAWSRTT